MILKRRSQPKMTSATSFAPKSPDRFGEGNQRTSGTSLTSISAATSIA